MRLSRGRLLIAVFLLAAGLRLAAIPMGLARSENMSGSFYDEYGEIAQNLAEGNGFSYAWFGELRETSIHAPMYPYLLSVIFEYTGNESTRALGALLLNTFFSLVLMLLSYLLARNFIDSAPTVILLLILAIYPTQIYYSVSGIPTALYAAMFLWVLLATVSLQRNPSLPSGLHLGVAIGLCALSYSFVLILAPLLALWIIWHLPRPRRREGIVACALAAVLAAGICTPWTLRNHRVHGHWILIRDQGGTNLWWGNGPYATGGPIDQLGNRLGNFPPEISERLRAIPNEVDGDRFLGAEVKRHIRQNPGRTLGLWMHKTRLFWWFDDPTNMATGSTVQRFLPFLAAFKALLLLGAGLGLFFHRRDVALLSLIVLVCLAIGGVHTIFHAGRLRYFFPLEPLLGIPAAGALWHLLSRHARFGGHS